MKTSNLKTAVNLVLLLLAASAGAQGTTALTYQGRLNDGFKPANGHYDLKFTLYNAVTSGSALGSPLTTNAVAVSNGLFTVLLDFGNVFDGSARWLDLAVRTNGAASFTTLSPRQPLTPTPYAHYAPRAGAAASATNAILAQSTATNAVTTTSLQPNSVTSAKIADGTVVRSLNGRRDALNLVAGAGMTLSSTSNTITLSAPSIIKPWLNPTSLTLPLDGTRTWKQLWQLQPTQSGYVMILMELTFGVHGGTRGGAWSGFYIATNSVPPTASTVPMNQQAISGDSGDSISTFRMYEFTVAAGKTYHVWFSGQYNYLSSGVTSASFNGMKWTLLHFTGTDGM